MTSDLAQRPQEVLRSIERVMEPGETVLWWSRPTPMAAARKALPICLFGAVFAACSLNIINSPGDGAPPYLFLLVGLVLTASPLVTFAWARNVVHAVTSDRLLTVSGRHGQRVTSHAFAKIESVVVENAEQGRADLTMCVGRDSDGDPAMITWAGVQEAWKAADLIEPRRSQQRPTQTLAAA